MVFFFVLNQMGPFKHNNSFYIFQAKKTNKKQYKPQKKKPLLISIKIKKLLKTFSSKKFLNCKLITKRPHMKNIFDSIPLTNWACTIKNTSFLGAKKCFFFNWFENGFSPFFIYFFGSFLNTRLYRCSRAVFQTTFIRTGIRVSKIRLTPPQLSLVCICKLLLIISILND